MNEGIFKILFIFMLVCISSHFSACQPGIEKSLGTGQVEILDDALNTTLKIKITIGEEILTATLNDSPTAKDFVSLLPLTLTLRDYNKTEKISDLPRKLSTKDVPAGYDPSTGDITYYVPWGNLAIFYRDFDYSKGLIALGRIDGNLSTLHVNGDLKASIELFK